MSFELQQRLHKEKEKRENEVRMLKLKLLKDQHETINAQLLKKKTENESNMAMLVSIANNDRTGMMSSLVERLNEFSARLIHAVDVLKSKYEEAVAGVHATPAGTVQLPTRLDLDLGGLEGPTLTSQEADSLRLLAMAGLASSPSRASPSPFPSSSQRVPPPPSGFPGPPQNNFPGPPPPIGPPGSSLLRPPPGMQRSLPTVADQLAAVAPQANVRPATMSRAPGGPIGPPRLVQPPIGTAARAPGPVNPSTRAPGGPTSSAASRSSGPSPSIPEQQPSAPGGAAASAPTKSGKKSSHEKLVEKLRTRLEPFDDVHHLGCHLKMDIVTHFDVVTHHYKPFCF